MPEPDTDAILRQLPYNWTSDEAEQIKALFSRLRPAVPDTVARKLWRYWQFHSKDEALFSEDKENIALILHARAYGERVPDAGDKNYGGNYLKITATFWGRCCPGASPGGLALPCRQMFLQG